MASGATIFDDPVNRQATEVGANVAVTAVSKTDIKDTAPIVSLLATNDPDVDLVT